MSDFIAVLTRAKAGDPCAFEELLEYAADPLYYYCDVRLGKKLRQHYDPFDITQETYVQALDSISQLECDDWKGFLRWLYRVAENRIRALNQHAQAKKRNPPGVRIADSRALDRLKARVTGPLTAVAREEQKEQLRRALDTLADDERMVVTMHFFQQSTAAEIAAVIQRPETTARRILSRGLQRLGSLLGSSSVSPPGD